MGSPIHQELAFSAPPSRIFEALMSSEQHAAFTGGGATDISPDAGGTFSCHGGMILGRNIELVADRRIVQAWRVANWEEGVYSIVRITLSAQGSGTQLVLDHAGVPEDQQEHIDAGWHARYWKPLSDYLDAG